MGSTLGSLHEMPNLLAFVSRYLTGGVVPSPIDRATKDR